MWGKATDECTAECEESGQSVRAHEVDTRDFSDSTHGTVRDDEAGAVPLCNLTHQSQSLTVERVSEVGSRDAPTADNSTVKQSSESEDQVTCATITDITPGKSLRDHSESLSYVRPDNAVDKSSERSVESINHSSTIDGVVKGDQGAVQEMELDFLCEDSAEIQSGPDNSTENTFLPRSTSGKCGSPADKAIDDKILQGEVTESAQQANAMDERFKRVSGDESISNTAASVDLTVTDRQTSQHSTDCHTAPVDCTEHHRGELNDCALPHSVSRRSPMDDVTRQTVQNTCDASAVLPTGN